MAAERAQMAKIDLNRASRDELTALPGLGPAAADAILKYRNQRGGFASLDELGEVPGIGAQTLQGLRGHLSLKGKGNGAAKSEKKGAEGARRTAGKSAEAVAAAADEGVEAAQESAGRGAEAAKEAGKAGAETLRAAGEAGARGADRTAAHASEAKAVPTSADTVLAGLQDIHREWLAYVQEQVQENISAGRAATACRSPQELVLLQARYARSSWSRFATESSKLANLTMRLMGTGIQPFQARGWESTEAMRREARP